jgi:hypothetical protein
VIETPALILGVATAVVALTVVVVGRPAAVTDGVAIAVVPLTVVVAIAAAAVVVGEATAVVALTVVVVIATSPPAAFGRSSRRRLTADLLPRSRAHEPRP